MLVVDFFVLLLCTNHRGHFSTYGSEPSTIHPVLSDFKKKPSLHSNSGVIPTISEGMASMFTRYNFDEVDVAKMLLEPSNAMLDLKIRSIKVRWLEPSIRIAPPL